METRRLEYFVVLTSERHFGQAAARLRISQSALSQQVQRLEKEVGGALVDRSAPQFALTPAGARLLVAARAVLEQVRRIEVLAQDSRAGRVGRLRVGVVPSLFYSQVPHALRTFRAANGDIETSVHKAATRELEDMCRLNQVDVTFQYTRPGLPVLNHTELYRDPYLVVLPSDHRLAGQAEVRLSELADDALLLSPRGDAAEAHDAILNACLEAGFSANGITVDGSTYTDQIGLVAAGMGVSLLPGRLAHFQLEGTCYARLADTQLASRLIMTWNPSVPDSTRDRFAGHCHLFFRSAQASLERQGRARRPST